MPTEARLVRQQTWRFQCFSRGGPETLHDTTHNMMHKIRMEMLVTEALAPVTPEHELYVYCNLDNWVYLLPYNLEAGGGAHISIRIALLGCFKCFCLFAIPWAFMIRLYKRCLCV